jgi:uncharacterized protein YqeY
MVKHAAPRAPVGGTRGGVRYVAASASASPPGGDLQARLKADVKEAMKAKDALRLGALRMLSAAVQQRGIELRESGGEVGDGEVIAVVQKMAKRQRDAFDQYVAGGRQDLADKEAAELRYIEAYLPAQLSRDNVAAAVDAAVAELGATSVKQMGAVMKAVMAKTAGAADNKLVSELVKARLSG